MFFNILDLKEWMVSNWVKHSEHVLPDNEGEEVKNNRKNRNLRLKGSAVQKTHLKEWLNKLPKMESHYCRKDSKRLYLEGPFNNMKEILCLYEKQCADD